MIRSLHMAHTHFQRHHKKYLLGSFGSFAVVKMFVLFFGLVSGLTILQTTTHAAYENFCSENSGSLDVPVAECEALVALYNSTDGANWTNTGGWGTSISMCNWSGITCASSRISQIYLSNNNLVGAIPTEIGDLTGLTQINFNGNRLISLPTSIGDLSGLLRLDINNNLLTYIPESIGQLTNLQSLDMNMNRIFSLPENIGNLTGLTNIDVSDNNLTTLPASFTELTALTTGTISGNCIDSLVLSPSMIDFLDAKGITYNNQIEGCITHQDALVVQIVREGDTGSIVSGDVVNYIIEYQNNGTTTATSSQVRLVLPKSLQVVSTEGNPTVQDIPGREYGPDRRIYGVTGDSCREDMIEETGTYLDILKGVPMLGGSLEGMQSVLSAYFPSFNEAPYSGQIDQIGDYFNILVYSNDAPFYMSFSMYAAPTLIDRSTLTGCGTQPTNEYIRNVGDLTVNESGTISFSVQATNQSYTMNSSLGVFTGEGELPLPSFSRDNTDGDLSLTYTNTSTDQSVGFWLNRNDLPLMTSNQSILSGVIDESMTDKEKIIALWDFVYRTTINDATLLGYHAPSLGFMDWTNPVRYINSLFGTCGPINNTLSNLASLAGFETRMVNMQYGGDFHMVTEIKIDGQRGMFDADGGSYYEDANDQHVYSVEELSQDPSRITTTPLSSYMVREEKLIGLIASGSKAYEEAVKIREYNTEFSLSLLPQDSIRYTYALLADNVLGRHKRYEVGMGKLTRHLSSDIYISEGGLGVTGQTTTGFLFDESMPYLVTNIDITRHDAITKHVDTSISFDGGHSWESIGSLDDRLVYDLNPLGYREDAYGYTLKFICDDCNTSDMATIISQTTIQNDFYFNPIALPTTGLDLYLTHDTGFSGVSLTWNKNVMKLHASITGSLPSSENMLNNTDMVELNVGPVPQCGNGIIEIRETCDDGGLNGTVGKCRTSCDGTVTVTPRDPVGPGPKIIKDVCTKRDCSNSYYDGLCGACPTTTTGVIHEAAPICTAYTPELNSAYSFAFSNTITTIDDCVKANLKGDLIRSHMAKMIVNFAIKAMKKTPNTGMVCNFTDMKNETPEMQQYAKLACQLGLMGVNTDGTRANQTFNPQETVDRGQFGTILSRLLRGGENNGGAVYYSKHLDALKTAGLMKNISRPENTELRGRVMLMLMRAFEKISLASNK